MQNLQARSKIWSFFLFYFRNILLCVLAHVQDSSSEQFSEDSCNQWFVLNVFPCFLTWFVVHISSVQNFFLSDANLPKQHSPFRNSKQVSLAPKSRQGKYNLSLRGPSGIAWSHLRTRLHADYYLGFFKEKKRLRSTGSILLHQQELSCKNRNPSKTIPSTTGITLC